MVYVACHPRKPSVVYREDGKPFTIEEILGY